MLKLIIFILTAFAVGLSGAVMPGPMLTVTVSDSVNKGFLTGPLVVFGHVIVEIVLIIFILAGFSWLVGSPESAIIIGTLGGIMLIYMGYKTSKSTVNLQDNSDIDKLPSRYGSILKGILSTISNPYFFIWWATIGLAFLFKGLELAGLVGLIGFIIGHWSSDLGWFSTVSFFSSRGSKFMSENQYNLVMKICGVFLILLGAYFLITAQANVFNFQFIK